MAVKNADHNAFFEYNGEKKTVDKTRDIGVLNTFLDELGALGLDTSTGIKYCGDEDFYREILEISVESYKEKSISLGEKYDSKDYYGYTIIVHSIKSGAANIGAMKLSNMARLLEAAGKTNDYSYIEDNHREFMHYYKQLMEGVGMVIGTLGKAVDTDVQTARNGQLSVDEWRDSIERLEYLVEELELDVATELVSELLLYDMETEYGRVLSDVKNRLEHFDVEGARESIKALL